MYSSLIQGQTYSNTLCIPFSGRRNACYFGKSPDLWICTNASAFPVIYQWLFEAAPHLQWPDRPGFSPGSFFIFAPRCKEPKYSI